MRTHRLHTHSKNKLVACPLTLDGEQCTECLSEDCRNCGTVPNKVQLAIGKEIMRTRSNFANTTIPTLDVSVAQLPLPGTMKVQPLDVRGIKEFLTRASRFDEVHHPSDADLNRNRGLRARYLGRCQGSIFQNGYCK